MALIGPRRALFSGLQPTVARGLGQGMTQQVDSINLGGSNWSMTCRSRHYSSYRFLRFRPIIQVYYQAGSSPLIDTAFPTSYNFVLGWESNYLNALSGIAPRTVCPFNGATVWSYNSAAPPSGLNLLGDWVNCGGWFQPGKFFGFWTTTEVAAQTGSNLLPTQRYGTNYQQRYLGVQYSASSQVSALTAISATSIPGASTSRSGGGPFFIPVGMQIETDLGGIHVVTIGDSISKGIGEGGNDASSTSGDVMGSPLSNAGYISRGIYEVVGGNELNLGRGNDGNKWVSTPANWTGRAALLALANPNFVVDENGVNDVTASITMHGWLGNTAYAQWSIVQNNSKQYVAISGGTSGAPGTGPSGNGLSIADGTNGLVWAYIQDQPAVTANQASGQIIAWDLNVLAQIRAIVPNAKVIKTLVTPNASSADTFETTAAQTSAWGSPPPTRRSLVNAYRRANGLLLNYHAIVDPNVQLEYEWPTTETGIWNVNGQAYYLTQEGIHPNSTGAGIASAAWNRSQF